MTPVDIIVLLKCFYSVEPRNGVGKSRSEQDSLDHWQRTDCVERETGADFELFRTTPRGAALVRMLCALPLPVEEVRFVNPMTGEVT